MRESSIRKAKPEREQWVVRHIQVFTGVVIQRVVRATARTLSKINRDLALGSRPTDRRTSARGDMSENDITDRVTGFATQEPSREYGSRFLYQPRHHQRATGEEDDDHGLFEYRGSFEYCLCKLALPTRKTEISAARRLATHRGSLPET